ncbi:MAG: hypothetical protein LBN40_00845 [Oscillospiraceae bacterium]|jgi:hypothetical protein|nr:hypothetical protein [Oscillospiraceae bacterium]
MEINFGLTKNKGIWDKMGSFLPEERYHPEKSEPQAQTPDTTHEEPAVETAADFFAVPEAAITDEPDAPTAPTRYQFYADFPDNGGTLAPGGEIAGHEDVVAVSEVITGNNLLKDAYITSPETQCRAYFSGGKPVAEDFSVGISFALGDTLFDTVRLTLDINLKTLTETGAFVWGLLVDNEQRKITSLFDGGVLTVTADTPVFGRTCLVAALSDPALLKDSVGFAYKPPVFDFGAERLRPDLVFRGGVRERGAFYPFGKSLEDNAEFYLKCDSAFSLKWSEIRLAFRTEIEQRDFSLRALLGEEYAEAIDGLVAPSKPKKLKPKRRPPQVKVEDFAAEYWNGAFFTEFERVRYDKDIFAEETDRRRDILFEIPSDFSECEVNGVRGFWVRFRRTNSDIKPFIRTEHCPKISQLTLGRAKVTSKVPASYIVGENITELKQGDTILSKLVDRGTLTLVFQQRLPSDITAYFTEGLGITAVDFSAVAEFDHTSGLANAGAVRVKKDALVRENGLAFVTVPLLQNLDRLPKATFNAAICETAEDIRGCSITPLSVPVSAANETETSVSLGVDPDSLCRMLAAQFPSVKVTEAKQDSEGMNIFADVPYSRLDELTNGIGGFVADTLTGADCQVLPQTVSIEISLKPAQPVQPVHSVPLPQVVVAPVEPETVAPVKSEPVAPVEPEPVIQEPIKLTKLVRRNTTSPVIGAARLGTGATMGGGAA